MRERGRQKEIHFVQQVGSGDRAPSLCQEWRTSGAECFAKDDARLIRVIRAWLLRWKTGEQDAAAQRQYSWPVVVSHSWLLAPCSSLGKRAITAPLPVRPARAGEGISLT
ncbi:hypothetical protein AOLI_G00113210 [Acnodon oligacanthus]